MKAATIHKYGTPSDIKVTEQNTPEIKDDEVLIRVKASAVNDYDWCIVTGKPASYRLIFGFTKPRKPILGMEMSGIIEKKGKQVKNFQIGDRVISDTSDDRLGSFAELVVLKEKSLTKLPESFDFVEGASIPHAAALAYQGLYDLGNIKDGMKVLVNGAGGGVGSFALFFCKQMNCYTTGVDTGAKLVNMTNIGYDKVIDYKKTDFTELYEKYDLILDAKTNRVPSKYIKVLNPGGVYVTVGGEPSRLIQAALHQNIVSRFSDKKVKVLAVKTNKGIDKILDMLNGHSIHIDKYEGLGSVHQAVADFGAATHTGKVVVEL